MSRNFPFKDNLRSTKQRMDSRVEYDLRAFGENLGLGPPSVRDNLFVESIHYGLIDHENNSIIPNEDYIVNTESGQVFDFVADSYSLMRLNWSAASQRGLVSIEGSAFGNLDMVDSYKSPRVKYGKYLGVILQSYNITHIPNIIGNSSIASYEDYVKHFFKFIFKNRNGAPITLSKWVRSTDSRYLDTGLAFSYANLSVNDDQMKVDQVVDQPSFYYFSDLCMNMGFSILKNSPNILLYEIQSPATSTIRNSYGLYNLATVFKNRFIKTYTLDNEILYRYINIYYNKYVVKNPLFSKVEVQCGKTVTILQRRETVDLSIRPYTDNQELKIYCTLRNVEEGFPFDENKLRNIYKKSKFLLKKLDKMKAIRYINNEFRDQVWNKNYGYHDLKKKLEKGVVDTAEGQIGSAPSGGPSPY